MSRLQAGLLNQSSAQVIEGSLTFNDEPYLQFTPSSTGDRRTFTLSYWVKRNNFGQHDEILSVDDYASSGDFTELRFDNNDIIQLWVYGTSTSGQYSTSNRKFRDTGWYHIVVIVDSTQAESSDRVRLYVNGEIHAMTAHVTIGLNEEFRNNLSGQVMKIGIYGNKAAVNMTNFYGIDGLALGPGYFGFTDPLTNTWRPKKFRAEGTTVNDGTVWSSYLTTNTGSINNPANAFDGDATTYNNSTANEAVFTFTPPTPIRYKNSVRIWLRTDLHKARINGGTYIFNIGAPTPGQWMTLATGSGFINTIDVQYTGGSQTAINAIEVDGVIMKDSTTTNLDFGTNGFYLPMDGISPPGQDKSLKGNHWTPVNFGGSNIIEKATGAKPFLNTTQNGNHTGAGVFGSNVSKEYDITVSDPGSGNKYYFDGVLTPTPTLYRGATYIFDYTAASSHPLYLSSLNDGKHNSKAYSVLFDGNGDELEIADHNDFNLGSGDFTIEGWVYVASAKSQSMIGCNQSSSPHYAGYEFDVMADGRLNFYSGDGSSAYNSTTLGASSVVGVVELNEWTHIAAVRSGTTLTLFRNGSKVAQNASFNHNIADSSSALHIGSDGISSGTSYHFHGYISNLRMVKGTAIYFNKTGGGPLEFEGFDVPSTTLTNVSGTVLLCCQDNNATTAVVAPSALSVVGNTAANNSNPFVYTDNGKFGLNTATSNVTKYTIPHIFNDTLYYFCNAHSGMGGSVNLITDETKADKYAWKNVFGLEMTAGLDLSNSLNCTSSTKTVTNDGVYSSTNSHFYERSLKWDSANTDSLTIEDSDMAMGTGDFTVEFWVYNKTNKNYNAFISTRETSNSTEAGFVIASDSGGDLYVHSNAALAGNYTSDLILPLNKWSHVAYTRYAGTHRLFLNGVLSSNSTTLDRNFTEDMLVIGDNGYAKDEPIEADVQDVRVYKGVAKYSTDFIPASPNPDIITSSPSGVSGKSKLGKITEGAVDIVKQDTSYIDVPASSDFRLDGEFCIEFFVRLDDYNNDGVYPRVFVLDGATGDGGTNNIHLNVNPYTGVILFWSGSGEIIAGTIKIIYGWSHIALTRDSSNLIRLFVDGRLSGSATLATDFNPNSGEPRPRLGGLITGSNGRVDGTFSNWRIVKGSAVYTAEFIPPSSPLTNITNTKLLCCQSPTLAGSAAVSPNISGVNNGTVWSSGAGPNFESANPAVDGFNGDADDFTRTDNANVTATVTLPSSVAFSSTLKVRGARDSGNGIIKITGGNGEIDVSSQFTSSSATLETVTISGVTSPISAISLRGISGSAQPRFSAIYVDDVMLVDPVYAKGAARATDFTPFNTKINTFSGPETTYPTLNPLDLDANASLSNGNLTVSSTTSAWNGVRATTPFPSNGGKYYFEVLYVEGTYFNVGIDIPGDGAVGDLSGANSVILYEDNGTTRYNNQGTTGTMVNDIQAGDTFGVAVDHDSKFIRFFINNTLYHSTTYTTGDVNSNSLPRVPAISGYGTWTGDINFGQKPFKYPPPPGFQPLNISSSLSETVITRPEQYVGVTTYTGDNSASKKIDDLSFSPDLVWVKDRALNFTHFWNDTVRGAGKILQCNTSTAETDNSDTIAAFPSFDSNGFTVGSNVNWQMNGNNEPYVGWCWKAGGSSNTFNVDDIGYASASDVGMDVGGKNSAYYNQTSTWSSGVTNDGITTPEHLFNGVLGADGSNWAAGTYAYSSVQASGGALYDLNLPTGKYRIRAYSNNSAASIKINGGNTYTAPSGSANNNEWWEISERTITSIEWIAGTTVYVSGIECDGRLLLDNGTSIDGTNVLNVPSIANTGCSVGTKQGFSIIKATGSSSGNTIAHGLGKVPKFVVAKDIDNTRSWYIYHEGLGANYRSSFDNADAASSDSFYFGSGMTDTFVTLKSGGSGGNNYNGSDMIYYIWADVPGLQKFGTYQNPSSSIGGFVELGFKPAILIFKCVKNISSSSGAGDWIIKDTTRSPYNNPDDGNTLVINVSNAEDGYYNANQAAVDILSNGFKIRHPNSSPGGDPGRLYIYAAWAEAPVSNLYGAISNAR